MNLKIKQMNKAVEYLEKMKVVLNDEGYTSIPSNCILAFDDAIRALEIAEENNLYKLMWNELSGSIKYGAKNDVYTTKWYAKYLDELEQKYLKNQ